MTDWIRYRDPSGAVRFGVVRGDSIVPHEGNMFTKAEPLDDSIALSAVTPIVPCDPTKLVALWNNSASVAERNCWEIPDEPLWFLKAASSFTSHRALVRRPRSYRGRITYEGELGVVIGSRCTNVTVSDADDVIFGYTCVNDVTALDLIPADNSFPQWCRAKGFDTFGPFGPTIAAGVAVKDLVVRTFVGGKLRQQYPVSDLLFPPQQLVSLISRDMTLEPGDVIACGTGIGALPMRPGVQIDVNIEGIGVLSNTLAESDT